MINQYIETFKTFKVEIFRSLYETIDMMFAAMVVSIIVGLLLGFILFITRSDGIYKNRIMYFIISGFINIIRSIPFILFIIVMIPFNRWILGSGFGVDASTIPLSLIGIATFARFTERDLLDVDKSIYETSYALGASTLQYCTHFLLKDESPG